MPNTQKLGFRHAPSARSHTQKHAHATPPTTKQQPSPTPIFVRVNHLECSSSQAWPVKCGLSQPITDRTVAHVHMYDIQEPHLSHATNMLAKAVTKTPFARATGHRQGNKLSMQVPQNKQHARPQPLAFAQVACTKDNGSIQRPQEALCRW